MKFGTLVDVTEKLRMQKQFLNVDFLKLPWFMELWSL